MPNWNGIKNEIKKEGTTYDIIRKRYLRRLYKITKRNIIVYYSGWLQKNIEGNALTINDEDKNGFMTVIHGLDRSKGLDLVLHTPGGEVAATESLVDYLRSMFGSDIRAIIPQLAMSGGTMIACACKEIIMGKQSSLGPIDPQFGRLAAHGIIEEFERAKREISQNQNAIPVWQPILAKYPPALIGECEKAIDWSKEMATEWLRTGMFNNEEGADTKIVDIVEALCDHGWSKSHSRHFSKEKCSNIGLKIVDLEKDSKLQDAVLSLHHICMVTLSETNVAKIIENQNRTSFIKALKPIFINNNHPIGNIELE